MHSLRDTPPPSESNSPAASTSSLTALRSPSPRLPRLYESSQSDDPYSDNPYIPYSDNPEVPTDNMLQTQRQLMDEQDVRLDELAHSIGRQRDLSLQINDELEVHHGLLEAMDEEVDRTSSRLSQARRKLDRVARGAKENSMSLSISARSPLSYGDSTGSTVMIGLIIFILLILIIVFKT